MAYLNHNLPFWNCYIRNEFLFNNKKRQGVTSPCEVHSVENSRDIKTNDEYFYGDDNLENKEL